MTIKTAHEIATEAARLVGGDRAQQHGDKGANFNATAVLWNAYLAIRKGGAATPITGTDFACMMVLAKMSRVHTGSVFNMDNFVDMAGYSACAGEVAWQELPDTQAAPDEVTIPVNLGPGWMLWNGGEQPVADFSEVELLFRDGSRGGHRHAQLFTWDHGPHTLPDRQIIAYKVTAVPL